MVQVGVLRGDLDKLRARVKADRMEHEVLAELVQVRCSRREKAASAGTLLTRGTVSRWTGGSTRYWQSCCRCALDKGGREGGVDFGSIASLAGFRAQEDCS